MSLTGKERELLDEVYKAFYCAEKPKRLTLEDGDSECMIHDGMWKSRDLENLRSRDVFQSCSFPWNELLTEGRKYFLPAIIRMVLNDKKQCSKWSGLYFVTSMLNDGELISECNLSQRKVVIQVIEYLVHEKMELHDCGIFRGDFEYVLGGWRGSADPS